MNLRTQIRNKSRAFTLIELMVVILILGILAALIVPRVVGRTDDAKISKAKADVSTLSSSMTQFRLDNDRYPSTEEGLQALRVPPSDATRWKGPYLEKNIPSDPWGNEYYYESPGSSGDDSFIVLCYGADGQPGGENAAADVSSEEL